MLNIHGGPFTQYGNRFFDEFQVVTGAGYAVVYSQPPRFLGLQRGVGPRHPRGRSSVRARLGHVDYEDVMAVVEEAVRRFDFVDADRLGVMGGSYGGYMTSWIVGHTDRFKAAISERAVQQLSARCGAPATSAGCSRARSGRSVSDDPTPTPGLAEHVRRRTSPRRC